MARGVNKVILVGNTGKDPEVRQGQHGTITTITLATTDTWRDKTTGENKDRTEWHRVVFFGKLGEIVAQYVKKGAKLYVEGALRTRKWQDQSGQDRYTTEIIANEMQMLDGRKDGAASGAADQDYYGAAHAPANRYQDKNDNGTQRSFAGNYSGDFNNPPPAPMGDVNFDPHAFDDDIPF